MPVKPTSEPNPEKVVFWRAKIEEQKASGLTQAEFCRRNNLTANDFSFWKCTIFPEQKLTAGNRRPQKRIKVMSPYERIRLVRKWEKSGLTQAEFCKRESIFEWQFSDWKTRILKEKKQAPALKQKRTPAFVEVKIEKENSTQSTKPPDTGNDPGSCRIVAEFHFSGGSISIFSEAEVSDIKKIVAALAEYENDRTK